MNKFLFIIIFVSLLSCAKEPVKYKILNQNICEIHPNIFGQFLEKASWSGEIGGDALIDSITRKPYPKAIEYLKDMNIPIIRYPGGIDVDYYPWYDLIDNAPGTNGKRALYKARWGNKPVVSDNRLGLDEFMNLCNELKCEPLLVVNLGDAYLKKLSISEAAKNAANMVAYCNIEYSANQNNIWPSVRTKNGHENAYKVKYWEVGNEPWQWEGVSMTSNDTAAAIHYLNCLEMIVDAMRAIDSNIIIITDGGIPLVSAMMKERLGDKINMVAYHPYQPWAIKNVLKGNDTINTDTLSDEDIWNAWVSIPRNDSISGLSSFTIDNYYYNVLKAGYPIALTEWNWNGWWQLKNKKSPFGPRYAKGIGAIGYLHAMMRAGDKVKMACQSMLIGVSWEITAVRIDSNDSYYYPTGKVTGFYSKYHGDSLMKLEYENVPHYSQAYTMNALLPQNKVAYIDALVTKSKDKLFFHAVNRHFSQDIIIEIDLSEYKVGGEYIHHQFLNSNADYGVFNDVRGNTQRNLKISLPKQSASIIEIPIF